MSKSKHKTITEAQHAVMEQIKMLDKDAQAHDFIYTSAAFALTVLRPLMIKHGISKFRVKTIPGGRWQNGIGVDYTLVFRYQLVGAEELVPGVTYQDVYVEASGKVGKSGDKSTFASQTTGSKYADLDFFNLPMVDDIESFEEVVEALENMYDDEPETPKKPTKEPEPEEEETEVPSSSSDLSYDDGVFDVIEQVFEAGGADALVEFTDGDKRKKVKALVKKLLASADEEDVDEDEPEEPIKKKPKKSEPSEETEVTLDDIDYDDEDMVEALFEQIDIEDDDRISEILSSGFTDAEALKSFYTVCLEKCGEHGAEFQDQFNETHFETLQEKFEELVD